MVSATDVERFIKLISSRPYAVASRRAKFDLEYGDIYVAARLASGRLILRTRNGENRTVQLADIARMDFMSSDCVRAMYLIPEQVQISSGCFEEGSSELDGFILVPAGT